MTPLARPLLALLAALPFALPASASAADAPDPLLAESTLPQHYPPFDRIRSAAFAPALKTAMAQHDAAIAAIAADPAAPTFDNTLVALERAGATLDRVSGLFYRLQSVATDDTMDATEREFAPLLARHRDALLMDARLFARVDALWKRRDALGLDAESARLLWRWHEDFVRAGATLSPERQAALRALDERIATLQASYSQNILKAREAATVFFDSRDALAGLPEAEIAAAAKAAADAGKPGRFAIELVNTTGQPALASLTSHASREALLAASLARNAQRGELDNRPLVAAIAKARAERAELLGYPNHAAWALAEETIGSVERVNRFLAQLSAPALASARADAARLQARLDAEHGGHAPPLAASDWAYETARRRTAEGGIDEAQLRAYYELDHVLVDGVFFAATRLYGLSFKERHDLPVYAPGVRVFDVADADGTPLAILVADLYARPNKAGGAWENDYATSTGLLGAGSVVAIHLNVPPPLAGEPTLLTQDEVTTAFHEFGHALHGMFLRPRFPRLAGNVPVDFVEYPSQFNEMWATWPEVLQHFARHWRTGAAMPQALQDQVRALPRFDQGFSYTETLASAVLDQAWHQLSAEAVPTADNVPAFDQATLLRFGFDLPAVPPRYRSPYFNHAFADQYDAGYYGYAWAEVLAADSSAWIAAHGGLTRANGDRYRSLVLARAGVVDALQAFRDFEGGEPDVGPLLRRRGLDVPAAPVAASAPAH